MKRIAIIGGGISGLSALHFLRQTAGDSLEITLFEKDRRPGGTINTDRSEGFISDWGPNGFLDKVPLTLGMVDVLGLRPLLEPASPTAEKRFIYRHDRLHEITPSPLKFLRSSLLTLPGRLRLVCEPFVKAKKDELEEPIFDFAARRIGREAAENMIVPMVSGIFGGDAKKLSLPACFPIMAEMEKEYGSLFKALIARKKAGSNASPAGPSGRLTSFKNGLYTLIETMHRRYEDYIKTGIEVVRIDKSADGFHLHFKCREPEVFEAVFCATPSYAAANFFSGTDKKLQALLESIPYASISVVSLGYHRRDVRHDLEGFGFLVPRNQNLRILGSIWTSSIFKDSAPPDMVQFRTMVGGATDPEAVHLSEPELIRIVESELNGIVGLEGKPVYTRIFKYEQGIPQFTLGHPQKMKQLEGFEMQYPGLYFTGNAYDGVGLNDCVIRSEKVVTRFLKRVKVLVS